MAPMEDHNLQEAPREVWGPKGALKGPPGGCDPAGILGRARKLEKGRTDKRGPGLNAHGNCGTAYPTTLGRGVPRSNTPRPSRLRATTTERSGPRRLSLWRHRPRELSDPPWPGLTLETPPRNDRVSPQTPFPPDRPTNPGRIPSFAGQAPVSIRAASYLSGPVPPAGRAISPISRAADSPLPNS